MVFETVRVMFETVLNMFWDMYEIVGNGSRHASFGWWYLFESCLQLCSKRFETSLIPFFFRNLVWDILRRWSNLFRNGYRWLNSFETFECVRSETFWDSLGQLLHVLRRFIKSFEMVRSSFETCVRWFKMYGDRICSTSLRRV